MGSPSSIIAELDNAIVQNRGCPDALGGLLLEALEGEALAAHMNEVMVSALDQESPFLRDLDGSAFLLLRRPTHTLHLQVLEAPPPNLHSVEADRIVAIRRGSTVAVDTYRIDGNPDRTEFRANVPLVPVSSDEHSGAVIIERKDQPLVYDYRSASPAIVAKLTFLPPADQIWVFSRETFTSAFPVLARTDLSAFTMLCNTVAAVGEIRALPMLQELADHPSHAVRWAAVQAIGRLDRRLGIEHLRRSMDDPHPHVRKTATKVLSKLGAADGLRSSA